MPRGGTQSRRNQSHSIRREVLSFLKELLVVLHATVSEVGLTSIHSCITMLPRMLYFVIHACLQWNKRKYGKQSEETLLL